MTTSISNSNIDNLNIFNNTTFISSKVCTNCNRIKPITEYSKNKLTSDGLQYSCNNVNLLKENIIKIIINKLMLIKFIVKMMLKHALNVNKLNQLQTLVKI